MIYLVMKNGTKLIILEPANVKHLKEGGFVTSPDKSVGLVYTHDLAWLQDELMKKGCQPSPVELDELLKEGLKRVEVLERPFHPAFDAAKKPGNA